MHALIRAFLEDERGSRDVLLETIREDPASGRAIRQLNFNVFDVELDYESGTATFWDILNPEEEEGVVRVQIAELVQFLTDWRPGT